MIMEQEMLLWVRGTGLQIAAAVFVIGMVYRMRRSPCRPRRRARPRWPR
jgi:hypothetical protein